jgi:succinoglycan biosynthesis transport protein ExoP
VLDQSRDQLARIPRKELQFARLQREAEGLEGVVTQLQSRLKEAEIAEAVEDPSVRLMDSAVLPRAPSSPKPLLNAALALVFGVGLGITGAFLRQYIDRTARSREDVTVATGVPVLGLLPQARRRAARRDPAPGLAATRPATASRRRNYSFLPASDPPDEPVRQRPEAPSAEGRRSPARPAKPLRSPSRSTPMLLIGPGEDLFPSREGYNQLATNLAFSRPGKPPQIMVVTSPLSGEGKTTVAVNLALTLAQGGTRVLLIDGDLRRGAVAAALGISQEPGLSDILRGSLPPFDAIQELPASNHDRLHVISCGRHTQNPLPLLSTELANLLAALRSEYDTIIVDTPPLNVVADAKLVSALSDGVLMVVLAGVTSIQALTFANEELRHVSAPVLGAVLNSIDFRRDAYYDEAYRYYASGASHLQETS